MQEEKGDKEKQRAIEDFFGPNPDLMTSGERLTRGYIATAGQEQKLREIWGEEFIDILLFNCNKIVEAEIGYIGLKKDPLDPQMIVNARRHLYRFRRAERVDTFMEMTERAMKYTGITSYRELRRKIPIMPRVITSEQIWDFLEARYNPEKSKHPMDTAKTREEKEGAIIKLLGEKRVEIIDNLILDCSTTELSRPEARTRLPAPQDYSRARAKVYEETRKVILIKAFDHVRFMSKKHDLTYEEVPFCVEGIITGFVPPEVRKQVDNILKTE